MYKMTMESVWHIRNIFIIWSILGFTCQCIHYSPTWESLDSRPIPTWYDEAKFGIFINWGVYSVPSFGSEWFWWNWKGRHAQAYVDFMKANYPPGFEYADFAPMFTAEFYDPELWADMFNESGARYIVLSSKHHEGFTHWPSNVSFNWNSLDVGPHRDLIGDLASAIRSRTNIHFGLYHSLFEWFHPLYLQDKANKFQTNKFVMEKTLPELIEIVNAYKPDVVWSDGDWEAKDWYWNSTDFIAWLYNESPVKDTVVTNDRWGSGCSCKHGDFYTCSDRYNPGVLQKHKWENCMTIDKASWGYRRNSELADYLSTHELITELVETVSCGGNLLMNVAPTYDGRIMPIYEERLRDMGKWLAVNGEAIFKTKPWIHQNDTVTKDIWYTMRKTQSGTSVYAITLQWPMGNTLELGGVSPTDPLNVSLLGLHLALNWHASSKGGIFIEIPPITVNEMPCEWAWVFRLDGLK